MLSSSDYCRLHEKNVVSPIHSGGGGGLTLVTSVAPHKPFDMYL